MRLGSVAVDIAVGSFAAAFEQAFLPARGAIATPTAAATATPSATAAT